MRVAINGTGIAGPTLAYWLRRFGHEPVLFERAPELRTGGYIIDFWGLGFEIADRMGLVPALLQRCYKMERLRMVDADGREVAGMDVTPMREQLHGRFISLSRADLSAVLFKSCDGIPARFGVSIAGIEQDGEGVTATFSDGRQDRFDLVVGADGLHSQMRELMFGPEERFETSLDCHVAVFRLSGYPLRDELTYVSHTVPKRQVARVALRDDETLLLLICRSELIDGDPPREQLKAALRRAFGDMKWEVPDILDRMDEVDDIYFDRVSQIHLPRWSTERVAVIGDAAACASLLAGEGTGLAMIEAYVLAGELHRADGDIVRALAAFEARLRSFVALKQKAALRFRAFFAPRTALALWVRNVAVSALAVPFLGNRLIVGSLQDDLVLPDYLATFP
ncbi:MAG TPA: FAD-binding domain [Vicinamibacterales bacterium]|jgi:2-polyprenyl-6-methoxyphenol hydroxylase-like FAD-dependent oxidoreductase